MIGNMLLSLVRELALSSQMQLREAQITFGAAACLEVSTSTSMLQCVLQVDARSKTRCQLRSQTLLSFSQTLTYALNFGQARQLQIRKHVNGGLFTEPNRAWYHSERAASQPVWCTWPASLQPD